MNPRFALVAAVVTLAGGAAAVRAWNGQPGPVAAGMGTGSVPAGSGTGFVRDRMPSPLRAATRSLESVPSLAERGTRVIGPTVYVAGAVRRAGVYVLAPGARLDAAIRRAGGVLPDADPIAVNFARPVRDGEEIVVPVRGAPATAVLALDDAGGTGEAPGTAASDLADASSPATQPKRRRHRRHKRQRRTHRSGAEAGSRAGAGNASGPTVDAAGDGLAGGAAPLDLNAATASDLANLPGIGDGLAERIVTFRAVNGPFGRVEELLDVNGISDRLFSEIEPYLTVAARP